MPGNQTVQLDSLVSSAPPPANEVVKTPTVAPPVNVLQLEASSITVPFCQNALQQGSITGDTYICVTSEKTSYVGERKTFILTPKDAPISAEQGYEGILVKFGEWNASDGWEFLLAPPLEQAWASGLYENTGDSEFPGAQNPGFRVIGNTRQCTYDNARFEILELVMDADGKVQHFAANLETHCKSYLGNGALLGVIRYSSTVVPYMKLSSIFSPIHQSQQ